MTTERFDSLLSVKMMTMIEPDGGRGVHVPPAKDFKSQQNIEFHTTQG